MCNGVHYLQAYQKLNSPYTMAEVRKMNALAIFVFIILLTTTVTGIYYTIQFLKGLI